MAAPNRKNKKYWLRKTFLINVYQQDLDNYNRHERQRSEAEYAKIQERANFQAQKEAAIAKQREKEAAKAAERAEWQRQKDEAIAKEKARAAAKKAEHEGHHEESKNGEFLTVKNTSDPKYADGSYLASHGFRGRGNHVTVIYDEDGNVIDTTPK